MLRGVFVNSIYDRQLCNFLLSIALLFISSLKTEGAEVVAEKIKVTGVYFYGYDGLDLDKIRTAIPLKAGDEIDNRNWFTFRKTIAKSVKNVLGKESSDEALIGTDKTHIVFIGLPGKSNTPNVSYLALPKKRIAAPASIRKLYEQCMDAVRDKVASGSQKDQERYLELQSKIKKEAQKDPDILLRSLENSSDGLDRMAAAHALGLIVSKQEQINALVKASNDSQQVVRNNAIRALGALLDEQNEMAKKIPPSFFINMLNSPIWTDRNKGIYVMVGLTEDRDPTTLKELRTLALPSLKEMCDWPPSYSYSALLLLGRIANIPEPMLESMAEKGQTTEILKRLDDSGAK